MARVQLKSRTPLARMIKIHKHLLEDRFPNCSSLAKTIEVSTKTIQRDIDYMRDQLELPIAFDSSQNGFFYSENVTHFPTIPTTEGEVLALFVAQKALDQYRGTPFEGPLSKAFSKLAEILGDDVSVDLHAMSNALSFHHTGVASTSLEIFQAVTKALMDCREICFDYMKLNGRRTDTRRVRPYHIASIDGQWYLFAFDLDRNDIRTFVIGRIQSIPTFGDKFTKPKDFSLSKQLMGSFGVYSSVGDFTVRISFDPFASQLVRERVWHPSQILKEQPGGRLEMTLQLGSLEEIERWILSWGGHAKVLSPRSLQQRVRDTLRDLQNAYADMPVWFSELHEAATQQQPDRLLQMVMALNRTPDSPGQLSLRFNSRD